MRYIFFTFSFIFFSVKKFYSVKEIFIIKKTFFSANNVYFVKSTNIFSKNNFFFNLVFQKMNNHIRTSSATLKFKQSVTI